MKKVNSRLKEKKPIHNFSFFENVYDVVRLIPKGRVTSYGAIARYLGTAKSARMVGYALSSSHSVLPPVPAHRVLNRNGLLSGKNHFSPSDRMEQLLEEERVHVDNNAVVDFEKLFWDPTKELTI
ncbi:MAG: MGMT family protein [Bacteroidetes bacterium]|nr:MGMT family protein [Bacteroidota bacterium]